jgi:hypothetical protein
LTSFSLIDMGIYEIAGGGRSSRGQQNRIGKTFTMAYGGYLAYEAGMDVWCNCPTNPRTGEQDHILNYPHYDFNPYDLLEEDLWNVYLMIDQAEQVMDATAASAAVRNLGNWTYQAKKRGIAFRFDTPRHKNIYNRVRLNPDAWIYPERIPGNWRLPLKAIRLIVDHAELNRRFFVRINNPSDYFPIYNDKVMLRPPEQ